MALGAVFFDIDGTLVPGTSSGQFLAGHLGNADLRPAEERYAQGLVTNQEVEAVDAAAWAGVTVQQIESWLVALPLIDGVQPVVDWCRNHDLLPVLATLAWQPVSASLSARFGFHVTGGPRVEQELGVYTGRVAEHFDEYDKRDRALKLCSNMGVSPSDCAAVGDSRSDRPLFEEVGFSIALNASPEIRRAVSTTIDTSNLEELIPLLERGIARAHG